MASLYIRKMVQYPKIVVIISAIIFILLTIFTFPPYFASCDEHEYLKNSFLLQEGTLTEQEITEACAGKFNGEGYISHFFIGRSIFLIPFTWFGFGAIMFSGLIIHLINFFIFYKIMQRTGYNAIYSILYLLYPAFLWEARTLNSEILVLTGLLAATYFYLSGEKKHFILSGFIFGITSIVRQESLLISFPFLLIPLLTKRKKFILLLAGFVPAAIILLGTNQIFYGGALSTGYGNPLSFIVDIGTNPTFFQNMGKFVFILILAYPLMILSPFLTKHKLRKEIVLASLIFIIFYAQNTAVSNFPTFHPTAFTGQLRYLIPLIGLIMLTYPPLLEKMLRKIRLPLKPVLYTTIITLFAISVIATSIHFNFLNERYAVFNQIYSNTETGSLLIGSSDDCNYVMNEIFDERAYLDPGEVNVDDYISNYDNVYVLDISYSTVDYSSPRGGIVANERQVIKDFIESNEHRIEIVYETDTPHSVKIYKLTG